MSWPLSSFVAVPIVDHSWAILNVKMMYPPKSPLENFWNWKENQSFVNNFVKALEDTQLFALELWDAKENDFENDGNAFHDLVGEDSKRTKKRDHNMSEKLSSLEMLFIEG